MDFLSGDVAEIPADAWQGRNNGYGGAAPRVSGGITVNFRRMNRVLELDEELAYALLEPGVSFQQLYDEIQSRGPHGGDGGQRQLEPVPP